METLPLKGVPSGLFDAPPSDHVVKRYSFLSLDQAQSLDFDVHYLGNLALGDALAAESLQGSRRGGWRRPPRRPAARRRAGPARCVGARAGKGNLRDLQIQGAHAGVPTHGKYELRSILHSEVPTDTAFLVNPGHSVGVTYQQAGTVHGEGAIRVISRSIDPANTDMRSEGTFSDGEYVQISRAIEGTHVTINAPSLSDAQEMVDALKVIDGTE